MFLFPSWIAYKFCAFNYGYFQASTCLCWMELLTAASSNKLEYVQRNKCTDRFAAL